MPEFDENHLDLVTEATNYFLRLIIAVETYVKRTVKALNVFETKGLLLLLEDSPKTCIFLTRQQIYEVRKAK